MKKNYVFLIAVISIISIPIIFYLVFIVGTLWGNRQESINTDWVKQYKTDMKTEFVNMNTTKVYYQHGSVHFDFTVNPKMLVDEYTQIVKKTKDLVLKETIAKLYSDQASLTVKFDSTKNIYVYESPYYAPNKHLIVNNYKVWYLEVNNKQGILLNY